MTATDPAARAAELRDALEDANYRYHVLDAPTMRTPSTTASSASSMSSRRPTPSS